MDGRDPWWLQRRMVRWPQTREHILLARQGRRTGGLVGFLKQSADMVEDAELAGIGGT